MKMPKENIDTSMFAQSALFSSILMTWTGTIAANAVMILFSIKIVTVYNTSKKIS